MKHLLIISARFTQLAAIAENYCGESTMTKFVVLVLRLCSQSAEKHLINRVFYKALLTPQ